MINTPQIRKILEKYIEEDYRTNLLVICETIGITRLARLTKFDKTPIETWSACRPSSMLWQVSAGKGLTVGNALISCIMEAYEGYSSEQYLRGSYIYSSPPDSVAKVDMNDIIRESRKLINEEIKYPKIFDKWIPAYELKSKEKRYVPLHWAFLCSDATKFGWVTNGLAAGKESDDVRKHGIYELIERHYLSACIKDGVLDKSAFSYMPLDQINERSNSLISKLDKDLKPHFLCVRNSPIPTIWCILLDESPPTTNLYVNFGSKSHIKVEEAIIGSLTEACQQRASQIQGTREDLSHAVPMFNPKVIKKLKLFIKSVETKDLDRIGSDETKDLFRHLPGAVYEIPLPSQISCVTSAKYVAPCAYFNRGIF